MLLPLAIGLSAASSIPNWVAGFNQKKQASQLEKDLVRPEYEIPEEQKNALSSAENQAAMTRLPGMSAMEGRLDQSTSNLVDTIERSGPGGPTSLNAASTAYGMQQDKITDLGIKGSQMWLGNQNTLRSEQNRMAEYENKKWGWDKADPYLQRTDAIRSLKEGSMRNFDNAAKDLFGGAANIALGAYMGQGDKTWNELFNTDKTVPTLNTTTTMDNLEGMFVKPTKQEFFKQQGLTPLPTPPKIFDDSNMPWNQGQYGGDSPYDFMKPKPIMSMFGG
jgi:hypothetical protein